MPAIDAYLNQVLERKGSDLHFSPAIRRASACTAN